MLPSSSLPLVPSKCTVEDQMSPQANPSLTPTPKKTWKSFVKDARTWLSTSRTPRSSVSKSSLPSTGSQLILQLNLSSYVKLHSQLVQTQRLSPTTGHMVVPGPSISPKQLSRLVRANLSSVSSTNWINP